MNGKIIFSTPLQEFRPVIWYGQPVHTRYKQLKSILTEKLGEKYANVLSEPVVSKVAMEGRGEARWMSSYIENPVSLNKLHKNKQEQAAQILSEILTKIKILSAELKTEEDASISELGELLLMAVEVPGTEYVFVQDDKIVLALWGFTSEMAEKTNFRINKAIEKSYVPPVVVPPTPPVVKDEPIELEKQVEKTVKEETPELKVTEKKEPASEIKTANVETPPVKEEKEKKRGWLWMLLGALLMFIIMFLIWWLFLKDSVQQNYLPPDNGVIPPVDTTKRGTDPDDPAQRVIFIDKLNVALDKKSKVESFAKKLHELYPDKLEIVYYDTIINLLQVKTPEGELADWTAKIKEMQEVRLVFNEAVFERSDIPSDPAFSDDKKDFYFDKIQAYKAWDITKGSEKVIVAVIDNGFDLTHPEFAGKIVKPWNVFKGNSEVAPPSVAGGEHGTHVAATAVGLMNNGQGLSGIAPNCKLMPIQVADENGSMSSLSIVSGVLYAIHQDADVINMSLGMMFPEEVLNMSEADQKQLTQNLYNDEAVFWNELYKFAQESDIVFVQAAGNDNILAGIDPGARTRNNIIVSAVNPDITKASFSNFGEYSTISAPGVQIYSAVPGGNYEFLQGTSMASPIVAGAVALIKSKFPDMKSEDIIKLMVNTGTPLDPSMKIGPMLQIENALKGDTSKTELVIPDDAQDLTFAEGRWKSTTDLTSTIDNSKVSLYFDIEASGKGKLTLVEESEGGTTCKADLDVSFKDGKLILIQKGNAECESKDKFYRPYKFECIQGADNSADCKAIEKSNSATIIDFKLEKQ